MNNEGSSGFLTAGASALLDNLTDNNFTIGFYYIPLGINGASSSPRMISKANTGTNSGYQFVRDEGSDIVSFSSGNGTTFNSFSHPKVTNGSAWDYWTIVYVKLTNTLSLYRHGTCLSTNVLTGPIAKNANPL